MFAVSNTSFKKLDRTTFPECSLFERICRDGLSGIYPFKSATSPDPQGWKFGAAFPPSHQAFGRMRSLLTLRDALLLKPRRVLEVAAGGGGLAAALEQSGCQIVVNDLRENQTFEALGEYANGGEIKFAAGNMFDLSPEQTGKFDLVLACEVIEHVAHPSMLLAHLKNFLDTGGRILLTTPNGSYFRNKLPTYDEIADFGELEARQFMPDADGHLFLLTPQELTRLAASVGLQVEILKSWGTPLLSGHAGLKYLRRVSPRAAYRAEQLTQWLPSAARERLCFSLSAILRAA